jgi:hypothetical protein
VSALRVEVLFPGDVGHDASEDAFPVSTAELLRAGRRRSRARPRRMLRWRCRRILAPGKKS